MKLFKGTDGQLHLGYVSLRKEDDGRSEDLGVLI